MNVEHENFRLRSLDGFVAADTLIVEERGHRVAEVGINDDVVAMNLFTARQLNANGAAAVEENPRDRLRGLNLSVFCAADLGKCVADAAEPAHHVVHAVGVLRLRNHGKKARTVPRRHAQVLRLERECQAKFVGAEIIAQNAVERSSCRNMGRSGKKRRADQAGQRAIGILRAWIELLEPQFLASEKTVQVGAFPGEVLFDLRLHGLGMRSGQHCFVGKIEGIHRFELLELQVIARLSSPLDEEFIKEKLHHQESRAEVEAILTETHLCVASSDYILLFENLDSESPLRQENGGSEPARTGSHDSNALLFAAPSEMAHSSTLVRRREEMARLEPPDCNGLFPAQEKPGFLQMSKVTRFVERDERTRTADETLPGRPRGDYYRGAGRLSQASIRMLLH